MSEQDNYPPVPDFWQIVLIFNDPDHLETVSLDRTSIPNLIANPLYVLGKSGIVYVFEFHRKNTLLYSDEYILTGRTTDDVVPYIFINDGENGFDDPHTPDPGV